MPMWHLVGASGSLCTWPASYEDITFRCSPNSPALAVCSRQWLYLTRLLWLLEVFFGENRFSMESGVYQKDVETDPALLKSSLQG